MFDHIKETFTRQLNLMRLRWLAIGGLVVCTIYLARADLLVMNLKFIFGLVGAVALLVMMGCWFTQALAVGARSFVKGRGAIERWLSRAYSVGIAVATVMAVTFVLQWGVLGAWLREHPLAAILPDGNLLIVGGFAGWMYVMLLTIFTLAAVWSRLSSFALWLVTPMQFPRWVRRGMSRKKETEGPLQREGASFEDFGLPQPRTH